MVLRPAGKLTEILEFFLYLCSKCLKCRKTVPQLSVKILLTPIYVLLDILIRKKTGLMLSGRLGPFDLYYSKHCWRITYIHPTADIYTVIRRDVPKHGFSVVQANTHRLTGQSKRESMFWNVSTNHCIYIHILWY